MNPLNLPVTRFLRLTLAGLVAAACLAASAQAQNKIAVINLKAVFDGYWKTKQSDLTLKERQGEFEKERNRMAEDYKKANEDYRKLMESASDPAVTADEREKRKNAASSKLLEVKEIENSVRQFDQQFRVQLSDQVKRMRENILREIRELVTTKARSGDYNLVIDTAAESVNQTPILVYMAGMPDLTEEILTQLNSTAPPGALTAPAKPEEKPEDKKDEKK